MEIGASDIGKQVGKLEAELEHWGAKLDELVAKTGGAGAVVRDDYRKRIDELKAKHQRAQAKLEEFKAAGIHTWSLFKAGIEGAWREFREAFEKLPRKS